MKKGQISIFIIVGVIVLISAAAAFYIMGSEKEEKEIIKKETPEDAIRSYITACLRQKTLEGLTIQSRKGGYIASESDEYLHHDNIDHPYWLSKEFITIPPIEFLEKELADHIDNSIDSCLAGFQSFKSQGYDIKKTEPHKVSITMENQVIADLRYPVEISAGNSKKSLSDYRFNVPINMKEIHNMATDITFTEALYAYLETSTNNMLSVYSGIDPEKLPPRTAVDVNLDCNTVTWTEKDVNEKLRNILAEIMPFVKIAGTDFKAPEDNKFLKSLIYRFYPGEYRNFIVDFEYDPEWQLKTKVHPSYSGIIKPENIKQTDIPLVSTMCNVKYQYDYDIEYPVLVTVTEKNSARIEGNNYYEGQGFSFRFPIYVWLSSNRPRTPVERVDPRISQEEIIKRFKKQGVDIDFKRCNQLAENYTEIKVTGDGKNIDNALVSIMCGSTGCDVGMTEDGMIKTKFPECENSTIMISKKGFAGARRKFKHKNMTIDMKPLKEIDIEVRKVNLPPYMQSRAPAPSALSEKEKAIIHLQGDKDVKLIYPTMDKAKISSGDYILSITLQGPVNIRDTPQYDEEGSLLETLPGVESHAWPLGRIQIPVTIDTEDRKSITFFVFEENSIKDLNPGTWDDMKDPIIQDDSSLRYNLSGNVIKIDQEQYAEDMQPVVI